MNGGGPHHALAPKRPWHSSPPAQRLLRQASSLLRPVLRCRTGADLAYKVVGGIVVLLVLNTALQYAAGPRLHHALPLGRGGGAASQQQPAKAAAAAAAGVSSGTLAHRIRGIAGDVAPGGADAELLCVDRQPACDPGQCSKVSAKYQECKATCSGCEHLRAAIQADTGLQVRVVQQLGACQDLHTSCGAWKAAGKCDKEPKAMLELCQASCGFCLPQAALTEASSSSSSSSGQPAGLLVECQDDINVCPYLAAVGLCASSSLWVETQCRRSCGQCTPGQAPAAVTTSTTAVQRAAVAPATAAAAAVTIPAKAVGSGKPSSLMLYGKAAGAAAFTVQTLEEWTVPGCRDSVDRCSAWARAGECASNPDYMAIACKASCGACSTHQTPAPFETRQLASGWAMPAVGFGTAGLGVGTAAAVEYAAAAGYRMFDSAESKDWYDEAAVGAGLAASKVPRSELFLTSKIHPRDLGAAQTLAAFERSLKQLRTSYLDLLLLHYPACFAGANCVPAPEQSWQESWGALEGLVAQGRVRSIGVSNFGLAELRALLALAKVPPSVLEARADPFAASRHLQAAAGAANVTFIAYSSFGTQWINSPASINPVFNSSLLQAVAARHPGKSVAQVVLRWALQKGQVVIPRSSSTAHIPENRRLFDFTLSDAEVQAIDGLDGTWKTGGLPLPVA